MSTKYATIIEEWLNINTETFSNMYPEVPKNKIRKFLKNKIKENINNPNCYIDNNYRGKSIQTTLLDVTEWIKDTKPICAGGGVFFRNQNQVSNPLAIMIGKFIDSRKKFKGQLKLIKDKNSYKYKFFDRKQVDEKIVTNAIYGCLGNKKSFLYNPYIAASVTSSGQSLISTTCTSFECFLGDNLVFNNLNECMTFLNNIDNEKYKMDESFLNDISLSKVYDRIVSMFYDYKDTYGDVIMSYLSSLPQYKLNRIYYKNNIYEFSKLTTIRSLIIKVIKNTDEFKDPNNLPKSSEKYLRELWEYYKEFVLYNYPLMNRIQRLKNDKRKSVVTIDTDSNMLHVDPWVDFICDNVIHERNTRLQFIAVNIIAYILTGAITTILGKYTKDVNIPKEYRKYINMKNEYLFSFMLLSYKKKRYITSIRLREGDEIYPEKIDIKGFDFVKSSATEDTKKYFTNIIKKRLIETNNISIPDILHDLYELESSIKKSLENGEKTYLNPKSVKEEGAYKPGKALQRQGFRGICIWNKLYPEMTIELPAKVDIVKLTLDSNDSLNQLKYSNPTIYNKIESEILNSPNKQLADKKVPIIAIPKNVDSIPEWIIPFIDYDSITIDVLKKFYPVIKVFGVDILKASNKKEYFSNIINI